MEELKHAIKWRREERWANLSVQHKHGDRVETLPHNYPCHKGCKQDHGGPGFVHHGSTVFVYVSCSCGWEQLMGDHINEKDVNIEGRLAFLDHKIEAIAAWNRRRSV